MEYTIGSLSDLITGSNTPNKKKVIKQQFVVDTKQEEDSDEIHVSRTPNKKKAIKQEFVVPMNEEDIESEENEKVSKKKRKKSKSKKDHNSAGEENNTNKKERLKSQKRKHDDDGEDIDNSADAEVTSGSTIKKKERKLKKKDEENNENSVDVEIDSDSNTDKKKRTRPKKRKHGNDEEDSTVQRKKPKQEAPDPERQARTIFVGNVPLAAKKSALKKLFSKYGNIDAIRYRGLPTTDPKVPKKVAFIKKEFHKDRASCIVYVRFDNAESAEKALEANGQVFEGHHLKVNMSRTDERPDESKAIFLGNITFNAEEEDLWKLFEPCGSIESVRLVRDKRTGIGKGFGYINFKSSDAVHLALEMGEVNYKGRVLRISMCNLNAAKRNKRLNKAKPIKKSGVPKPYNKGKRQNHDQEQSDDLKPKSPAKPISTSFQGSKFTEKKKKNKLNKGVLKKKVMMKKLTPKSKSVESQD